ncbi:MAG: hypothetical protein QM487_05465 [Candidatus Marithrix sp.]
MCGTDNEPSQDYIEVANEMIDRGINISYLNTDGGHVHISHPFLWDFLIVEQNNHAVIWTVDNQTQIPQKAIYRSDGIYENEELYKLWGQLKECSKTMAKKKHVS